MVAVPSAEAPPTDTAFWCSAHTPPETSPWPTLPTGKLLVAAMMSVRCRPITQYCGRLAHSDTINVLDVPSVIWARVEPSRSFITPLRRSAFAVPA